ncbi:sensor histidine kinase [Pedobacter sp. Leaf194]|uniref:sensor histidine kinase n=1 Tax=Pedobacter sp. Leaf194 TaxID=1736297 RepID=UPI0007031E5A|nr:sensor histidine kinase [Pedobacter sp. Leaf194]KQS41785.1 hypothetical protein ASG14_04880 [Pedobacter sp. Leaf194]
MISFFRKCCAFKFFFWIILKSNFVYAQKTQDQAAHKLLVERSALWDKAKIASKDLELAQHYIDKAGESKEDILLAQKYCSEALKTSREKNLLLQTIRGYTIQAQIKREKGDQKSGNQFADLAVSQASKITDPATLASVYFEKSSYYEISNDADLKTKIKFYELACNHLKKCNPNTLKLADALKYLGDLYGLNRGKDAAALACLFESLAIYKANHYKQLHDIYDLIGYDLARMERRREGLKYTLMAVRTAEELRDSSMTVCTIYNRLSYAYNNLNQDAKATAAMEKAVMYARHNRQNSMADLLTSNLAVTYIHLKQYDRALELTQKALAAGPEDPKIRLLFKIDQVRIYTAMGKLKSASLAYRNAQQLSSAAVHSVIIQELMCEAGIKLFMSLKNYKKVDSLINNYRGINAKTGNFMAMAHAEQYAYQSDSLQQRFKEAFFHHQAYTRLNDSLVNRNHDKETAALQLQFETEKKDRDIALKAKDIQMLTKQADLKNADLRNQTLIRNLSMLAVAMLLGLSVMIYSRYRLKRRAISELEAQKKEINAQNEFLRQLVTEREWLVKEVHHRVKNNLQIVVSLLNSQSGFTDNVLAKELIRESKNRINSISIIHQRLYQTEDMIGVDMAQYIRELVEITSCSFGVEGIINFTLELIPLTLDVSQAVPVGLILNEALTNAVKYATLPDRQPSIRIVLSKNENLVNLTVADNGNGLPEHIDLKKPNSLGLILMSGLSKQLGGCLLYQNKKGLELSLEFKRSKLLGEPLIKMPERKKEVFA